MTFLVIVAMAPAVVLVAAVSYLLWRDRWAREPVLRLVEIQALGAAAMLLVVTYVPLLDGETPARGTSLPLSPPWLMHGVIAAASGEALFALLAVILVAMGGRFLRTTVDGAVVGISLGCGAALARAAIALAGGWRLDPGWLVFSAVELVACAGLLGALFAMARATMRWSVRLGWVGLGWVTATAAHAICWAVAAGNGIGWLGLIPAVVVLAAVIVSAIAAEIRLVVRELGGEVEFGVVPAWVLEVVRSPRRRALADWWPRQDERRAVVRLLLDLAVQRRRVRGLDPGRKQLYGLEVGRLRQRVKAVMPPDAPFVVNESVPE